MVGNIYSALICCQADQLHEVDSDPYSFELMRRCPHAKAAAYNLTSSCQFAPCHCSDLFCDVNQMYAKLISATYYFVRQYARVTGNRFGVTKVYFM